MASSSSLLRFLKRNSSKGKKKEAKENISDYDNSAPYFGDTFTAPPHENKGTKKKYKHKKEEGEQILLNFIRTRLGHRAENLAVILMNKTPLKAGSEFTYALNQFTEGKPVIPRKHYASNS